jgi:hypothetical protein
MPSLLDRSLPRTNNILTVPRIETDRLQVYLDAVCSADDDAGLPSTAMILSLSTKGVGLISSVLFDRGSILSLDMTNEAKTISRTCRAEVVQVRPFSGGNWIVGAEFLEPVSHKQVQALTGRCTAAAKSSLR